jgi:hypothetical protein
MADDLNDLIFKEDVLSLDNIIEVEIKKSIKIKICVENTHIFVLALNSSKNKLISIDYKEKSIPMAGCVYDAKFGKYYVECVEYLDLGTIPVSFSIKIDKISRWESKIPITEPVIKTYLSEQQVANLEAYKIRNKGCRFEFMQLVSCY